MGSRIPILLLILVVVPTVILSLMAGRSVRLDEAAALRQLEAQGRLQAQSVVNSMTAMLEDTLTQVGMAFTDALAGGGELQRIGASAGRVKATRPVVREAYLFMTPWGFLWPEDRTPEAAPAGQREELLRALRAAISTAAEPQGRLTLTLGEARFLFKAIGGRQVYYAGYQVDRRAFDLRLVEALRTATGGGVLLSALGGGLESTPDREHPAELPLIVRDSLGREAEIGVGAGGTRPLAVGRLDAPHAEVAILAYAESPGQLGRLGAMRRRLYRWGVAILALGIVGGVWYALAAVGAELRRARARNEFVVGVSHDLKTPLASMKVLAESLYLGRVADGEKRQVFLGTIVREADRLGQLIERVLYLVRFGQDALSFHRQPGDIGAVAAEAVEAFRSRYVPGLTGVGDAGIRVELRVAAGLPPVNMDPGAITQLLLNLLDNAAKYGRGAGETDARITVTVAPLSASGRRRGFPRRLRTGVALEVRDAGPGIPVAARRKIFRRFYRAPGAHDENVSGVGLGLALCRHVVRAHGGRIFLAGKQAAGCTFRVELPACGPAGEGVGLNDKQEAGGRA